MAYYRCEVIFEGGVVNVDKDQVESDVAGKTHHVFYHTDDKNIERVRTLLGQWLRDEASQRGCWYLPVARRGS